MAIDRTTSAWLGLASAVLLTTACGQRPAANTAAEPGAAANGAAANQAAVAPAAPHPVTMEPDPANQTGPVARAVDADFPEPCQTYVRDTQACIDRLSGPGAIEQIRELRLQLHSNRGTWLRVQDRAGLTSICRDNLGMLRQRRRELGC